MKRLRWTLALLLSMIAMALGACATTKAPNTVLVGCGAKVSDRPDYPFARVKPEADIHEKTAALLAERKLRIAREGELEAALTACQ